MGIYLWFKIYFLIDTNAKIWTEIIDLVILGRNYWSSGRVCMFLSHLQRLWHTLHHSPKVYLIYLWHLWHALIYTVFNGLVGKLLVSAFQIFLWIENRLNIKKVMSKDVSVCSFPIFDIFDIHCIRTLRCIWSIFNIDSITFKENENDIFNMSHTL